jgi:hypothetical protein
LGGVLSLRAADVVSPCFRHAFNSFSQTFAFSCFSLFFPSNAPFVPPTVLQTESKGNFCLMTLYSHKSLFQPQALHAKKQTFSNSACLSLRAADSDLRHLRGQEEACLSLRAAEELGMRA